MKPRIHRQRNNGVPGEEAMRDEERREKALRLIKSGLHFCNRYNNLVRYNPEFCGNCEHNGFRAKDSPALM
jgi:regulator of replication initiation timing